MVYVCIDGCNVDGHAIAFVEFAGVLLQLFCATMRATLTYQAYRWLLQKAADAAVMCRRRCCNCYDGGLRIGGAGHNIIILVVRVHFLRGRSGFSMYVVC